MCIYIYIYIHMLDIYIYIYLCIFMCSFPKQRELLRVLTCERKGAFGKNPLLGPRLPKVYV